MIKLFNKKFGFLALLLSLSFNSFASSNCDYLNNDTKVLAWSYEAMLATNSYSFVKPDTPQAANYYTETAWQAYQDQYKKSGILEKVIDGKLIVSVGLENSPLILKKDATNWQIQLPLLINYLTSNNKEVVKKIVILDIIKDENTADCLKITNMVEQKTN